MNVLSQPNTKYNYTRKRNETRCREDHEILLQNKKRKQSAEKSFVWSGILK